MRILNILLVFFSLHAQAQDLSVETAAQSKEWKYLLHYVKNIWGYERSLLDGEGFFLAKDGRIDALAELRATIAAMNSSDMKVGKFALHPQCAFPARLWFLKERLKMNFAKVACPRLDEFYATFKEPETVSVVFSSAYPNNPASMFGHTFLKVNSKKRSDLTDVGINYAAHVSPDENSFAFMYFGLFGGYHGLWSTENYYSKIKDYNQMENRDLWEYELNLTSEETKKLIYHFWELETNSFFYYFFFDENCSYQILAGIDAVKPEWGVSDYNAYVIPGESIKSLYRKPGIVRDVHFRPSLQRIVLQKYEAMTEAERGDFFALIEGRKNKSEFPLALEAGMSYYEFLNVKKKGQLSETEKTQQNNLLAQRAGLGPLPELQKRLKPIEAETRPDLGHDSSSMTVGQTFRERRDHFGAGETTNLKLKTAYQDLLNNDSGFKRYSHIDFPSIEFQYDSDLKSLRLNDVNLVSITSLPPLNFLSHSPAWKMESGLYTARDYGCLNCRHVFLEVGIGVAANLFSDRYLFYALTTGRGEAYGKLDRGYRYGPGVETGVLLNPFTRLKFRLTFKQFWDVDQDIRSSVLQNYLVQSSFTLARNYELRGSVSALYPRDTPELRNINSTVELIYFFH